MKARPSKRAQVEAMGWKFTPIPRHVPAGAMWHNSQTGQMNAPYDDYKNPDGWLVTPPDGHPGAPRRFDNRSPIVAVRWAYQQAMAPRPDAKLGGVAALAALMGNARSSGAMVEAVEVAPLPTRPDALLLSLCEEAQSLTRLEKMASDNAPAFYLDRPGHMEAMGRARQARSARQKIIPQVLALEPSTLPGGVAKARTVFGDWLGQRGETARLIVRDLVAVLEGEA